MTLCLAEWSLWCQHWQRTAEQKEHIVTRQQAWTININWQFAQVQSSKCNPQSTRWWLLEVNVVTTQKLHTLHEDHKASFIVATTWTGWEASQASWKNNVRVNAGGCGKMDFNSWHQKAWIWQTFNRSLDRSGGMRFPARLCVIFCNLHPWLPGMLL